jgi:hypothetical protein
MNDSTRANEDAEQVYEAWRQGITPPSQTELMAVTTFESFVKSAWVAGWVARGRIPVSSNSSRR